MDASKPILVINLFLALLTGHIAARKNRNSFGWGVFGFVLPIIALPLILISPRYCFKCRQAIRKKDGEHVCNEGVSLDNLKITKNKIAITAFIVVLFVFAFVYFNNLKRDRYYVDPESFAETFVDTMEEFLNNPITKNQEHVYLFGNIIPGADPKTFVILDGVYGKDSNHVFYMDEVITNADPETFIYLGSGFGSDKNQIYYESRIVQNASRGSFTPLEFGYANDENFVFSESNIIEGANPKTFRLLNHLYSKDDNRVYCRESEIKDADVLTFNALDIDISVLFAKDKDSLFHDCQVVENISMENFEYLGDFYFKNLSAVYYYDDYLELMEYADPSSFELLGDFYAKDNNYTYRFGKIENQE